MIGDIIEVERAKWDPDARQRALPPENLRPDACDAPRADPGVGTAERRASTTVGLRKLLTLAAGWLP
jgi:hypothetical protein